MPINNITGVLDGAITTTLRTLDKNPMVNAVGIDLVAMVAPRTYVDTTERNKYAGAETFFREFTGTLIVCLSASYFAKGIAWCADKIIDSKNKINTNSWFSDDSVRFLNEANKSGDFVSNVINSFDINSKPDELVDEKVWKDLNWDNKKYSDFYKKIVDKESLINGIKEIINDKNLSKSDKKKLIQILDLRLTNFTKSDSAKLQIGDKILSASVSNILRDMIDIGRDVFSKPEAEQVRIIEKILKINKIKSAGALILASSLGLINQYVNRKITEKRTGTKGFVGDINYKDKIENKISSKDNSNSFKLAKVVASLGMASMAILVMGVKSPKDFMRKLEFTGAVTSGNAIKTVYASTLIGRFLASDNKDELRETTTRDYLGFLNWLVLGGFASKGVANMLDIKRKNLFKGNVQGKGIKNWLNNISLKSHNEIAVMGKEFAGKNMWKLNLSQVSGIAYSTIALGILLPKLNIWITNRKQNKKDKM